MYETPSNTGISTVATFSSGKPTRTDSYLLLCGGIANHTTLPDGTSGWAAANVGDSSTPVYFKDGVPETCSLRNIKTKNITTTANIVDSGLSVNNVILSIWYSSEAGSWKVH